MITDSNIRSRIEQYWPKKEVDKESLEKKVYYRSAIKQWLRKNNACLVAHYYVDHEIQKLAEETDGMLGDSLAMANFGYKHHAKTLIVAGVRFMGESVKILSSNKRVLMPTLKAECSLDLSCNEDEFKRFIAQHPSRTVVVYVNTSARIKALADWTVTSSNALNICKHLDSMGKKILWAPDKYLGNWIRNKTSIDMINYNGFCVVHEEFQANSLKVLKSHCKDAAVLVHPESPENVIAIGDVVGSTSQLLHACKTLPNKTFIVATDMGIFYKMKQMAPDKIFIKAPTAGHGGTCKSCSRCPWMAMNSLKNLFNTLHNFDNEITIPEEIRVRALIPLKRMVNFQNTSNYY